MASIYIVLGFRDPVPLILVIFHKDIVQHNFPSRLSNPYIQDRDDTTFCKPDIPQDLCLSLSIHLPIQCLELPYHGIKGLLVNIELYLC